MSETYETPRGGRKPSKLPRFVKEQAAGVSSMLKSMSEHEAGMEPSPRSSQGSLSSRIPLLQTLSTPNRKQTSKSSEFDVLKLNVSSLGSLKDISPKKAVGTDKHRVMQLVKEIPGVWAGVVVEMAKAYNEMVELVIDHKLGHQPQKLSSNTASIKNKIEAAKTVTTSKFTLIERYMQEGVGKSPEPEKLVGNIKTLNQKIKTLGCKLNKAEATLQQEMEQAASTKEALECRLKETTEALEKALADLTAGTNEKPAPLEVLVPKPEAVEAIHVKKNTEKGNSGKQIQLLKSTVRKLETNVEQLSRQNENLRKMLATAKRQSSKEESDILENNVGHTLQQILTEKQHNLEKLSFVIQKIKEHHNNSRDQQKQLDTRVQLLQSQM